MAFAFWLAVAIGLTVSRIFVTGEIDNSPASLYKDAAHLLFGMAFMYACCKTWPRRVDRLAFVYDDWKEDVLRSAERRRACLLWGLLVLSLIAEVAFALRDNF